jgi:hypothetical protein
MLDRWVVEILWLVGWLKLDVLNIILVASGVEAVLYTLSVKVEIKNRFSIFYRGTIYLTKFPSNIFAWVILLLFEDLLKAVSGL